MCVRLRIFSDRENAPLGALARARSFVPRLTNGPSPHFNALCINQFCRNCRAPTRHYHHHSFHFPLSLSLSRFFSLPLQFSLAESATPPAPNPRPLFAPLPPLDPPYTDKFYAPLGVVTATAITGTPAVLRSITQPTSTFIRTLIRVSLFFFLRAFQHSQSMKRTILIAFTAISVKIINKKIQE